MSVSQELALTAKDSKAMIKRINRQVPIMTIDPAIPNHGSGFNIEVG